MQESTSRQLIFLAEEDIPKKIQPHQSRLGNSSNYYEIPRQAWSSNGGPQPLPGGAISI